MKKILNIFYAFITWIVIFFTVRVLTALLVIPFLPSETASDLQLINDILALGYVAGAFIGAYFATKVYKIRK
jgi:hypothetical protein